MIHEELGDHALFSARDGILRGMPVSPGPGKTAHNGGCMVALDTSLDRGEFFK